MLRLLKNVIYGSLIASLLMLLLWGCAAITFDGPPNGWGASALILMLIGATLAPLRLVRSRRRGLAIAMVAPLAVLFWWRGIEAQNERDWLPDVARPATATIVGNALTVHNVRDFFYRSEDDYQERWTVRSYDLSKLVGVDLFLSYWGPTLYAHSFMSWEFADGSHLTISIETRKENGETFSTLAGFFRRYELYYVVAEERDVVGVRASHRGEALRLYRLAASPSRARQLLLDYVASLNRLAREPEWYNAIVTNCTTTIFRHLRAIGDDGLLDWRILANGYLDEFAYDHGALNRELSFADLRAASDVTALARAADGASDFSARIRDGLPLRPPYRLQ